MAVTHFGRRRHSTTAIVNFDCRRDEAHCKFSIHDVHCFGAQVSSQLFLFCVHFHQSFSAIDMADRRNEKQQQQKNVC